MCTCPSAIRATTSPGFDNHWGWPHNLTTVEWTSPLTNRLLFEAGFFQQNHFWSWEPLAGTNPNVVGILDQGSGINFKLRPAGYAERKQNDFRVRGAVSYITGAHAFKVGFDGQWDTFNSVNNVTGTPPDASFCGTAFHQPAGATCGAILRPVNGAPNRLDVVTSLPKQTFKSTMRTGGAVGPSSESST